LQDRRLSARPGPRKQGLGIQSLEAVSGLRSAFLKASYGIATVELLGRAAPASLAEAIERMTNNGDTLLVAHTIGTLALTVIALRGVPWQP
jgi:hypothetical protein